MGLQGTGMPSELNIQHTRDLLERQQSQIIKFLIYFEFTIACCIKIKLCNTFALPHFQFQMNQAFE